LDFTPKSVDDKEAFDALIAAMRDMKRRPPVPKIYANPYTMRKKDVIETKMLPAIADKHINILSAGHKNRKGDLKCGKTKY
jgi:hypothetical protein